MSVIIVTASIVFSMFLYNPMWFDSRPHYFSNNYQSKQECQDARKAITDKKKGSVCTDKHDLYVTK